MSPETALHELEKQLSTASNQNQADVIVIRQLMVENQDLRDKIERARAFLSGSHPLGYSKAALEALE